MGNYLWQAIVLQKIQLKTLLVGMVVQMNSIRVLFGEEMDPLGLKMAAGCVLFVPSLLIFVAFHRVFIKDFKMGALIK